MPKRCLPSPAAAPIVYSSTTADLPGVGIQPDLLLCHPLQAAHLLDGIFLLLLGRCLTLRRFPLSNPLGKSKGRRLVIED